MSCAEKECSELKAVIQGLVQMSGEEPSNLVDSLPMRGVVEMEGRLEALQALVQEQLAEIPSKVSTLERFTQVTLQRLDEVEAFKQGHGERMSCAEKECSELKAVIQGLVPMSGEEPTNLVDSLPMRGVVEMEGRLEALQALVQEQIAEIPSKVSTLERFTQVTL